MKWNERSREERTAIEIAILATVREADVKVQTVGYTVNGEVQS